MASSPRYESEDVDVTPLSKPLKFEFSGKTAPNRFLKAAMSEQLSSWDPNNEAARGIPSKELINLYRRWGEGAHGVLLTGNVMLFYDQLEGRGNLIITANDGFSGERFEAFKELATVSKKHGSLVVAQVSHPGRQISDHINEHPISASDVQLKGNVLGMTFAKPRAATQADIDSVVDAYAHAAEYLEKAGYDGIELHGAHGYLIAQFLSPTTNHRTDKYGGSLENRSRLILEIAQEIRKRTSPNFILSIKLNSVEFQDQGFTSEDARKLCSVLESNSFDFVELTGGTYEHVAFTHTRESTKKRESFFIEFAEQITPTLTKTKIYVTGGFLTAGGLASALDSVDGVGIGRPTTLEPLLPKLILEGKVKGAIVQRIDRQNFGLSNVASGTQMKQIGKDKEPIDLSQEENEKAFLEDMGKWVEIAKQDTEKVSFGYVDISSVPSIPYGVRP